MPRKIFAHPCRFPTSSFVVPMRRQLGQARARRQTMRVMVLVKGNADTEAGLAPTPEMLEAFAAMDRFTEELVEAGVFIAGAGLKPGSESKRIAYGGTGSTVIDGPFAEAR